MTALLTDNLPLLAGAPNGIKKLRELILELAVRGKLLEQNSSDEPASELLKSIAKEKALLIENKSIRKGRPLPDIKQDEMQFKLPIGWEWVRLGQIGDWGAGATPARGNSSYYGGEMPWFKSGELVADFISCSEESVTELALKECSLRRNKPGDVLIAMYGATIGKTAILSVEGTTNQAVCACTPFNGVFNRYLLLTLKALKLNFIGQGAGGAQPNISREKIIATATGLPPLAEQHRIVAKVDELMALCDRLEAQQTDAESAHAQLVQTVLNSLVLASDATDFASNWQRLAENLHTLFTTGPSIDALKQALLNLAVMGKLVPQDPRDEPASELMTQLRKERSEWLLSKQDSSPECKTMLRKLSALSEASPPFPLPASWQAVHLIDCSRMLVDCHNKTAPYVTEGIPIIRTSNIRNREFRFDDLKYVNDETYEYWSRRCPPEPGDIMFTREAPMGEAAIIPDGAKFCLGQRTMLVRTMHDYIDNRYLLITLTEPHLLERASTSAIGSTVKHLRVGDVEQLNIPLPPRAEQQRIVAKVDQLMVLCDQLKTRLTQARQLNEQLASTLVEQALAEDGQQTPMTVDRQLARTLLAAEITHRLHSQRTFGQRKLQKVIYLAEHAARLAAIQGDYLRDAAGPHDRQLMNKVEGEMQNHQWYERIERETVGYAYRPLSQAGLHRQAYSSAWSAAERTSIEQVIELMRDWDTDRCEMTVTLYAAWNDFILEGRLVSDEAIVSEVMHSWNDTKLRFCKTEWLAVLAEIKKHKILMPNGFGKRTTGGMLSLPGFE
ncbi:MULTISPECIES: restriction endonuclease subunit S [unclassified Pseudomonas]|uniref:restriction endonuclease subunit S n=1 Tax=unclassified Pseudomonas TaxID=196821 RepID=UPI00087163A2|nr:MULTISPECIES: restriction endonuclease subunit S [unclassified Pseudomonas]SCW85442.1 type I restriction enzyme, S subunit [Pseudomonas sp. NFACC56-3]SFK46767.1 type I restriction enzyme, S subunit [Pseudomonas sp. NFACC52]